jgi:hydrogenase nickel incorporation protein HypA/HybF
LHELSIAQAIVDTVSEAVGDERVTEVVLEVGALSLVVPDALQFCFELATADTPLAGARLTILQTPGEARCRVCQARVAMRAALGRCQCGATDLEWLSGEQLKIKTVEVA